MRQAPDSAKASVLLRKAMEQTSIAYVKARAGHPWSDADRVALCNSMLMQEYILSALIARVDPELRVTPQPHEQPPAQ